MKRLLPAFLALTKSAGVNAVQTVEPVQTVQSTTTHRHRTAGSPFVTTTQTTVRERVVPTSAVEEPSHTEVVQPPVSASTYPARLYDLCRTRRSSLGGPRAADGW